MSTSVGDGLFPDDGDGKTNRVIERRDERKKYAGMSPLLRWPLHDHVALLDEGPAGKDLYGRGLALDVDHHAVAQYLDREVLTDPPVDNQLLSDLDALLFAEVDESPVVAGDLSEIGLYIDQAAFDSLSYHGWDIISQVLARHPLSLPKGDQVIALADAVAAMFDDGDRRRIAGKLDSGPAPPESQGSEAREFLTDIQNPENLAGLNPAVLSFVQVDDVAVAVHGLFVLPFRSDNPQFGNLILPYRKGAIQVHLIDQVGQLLKYLGSADFIPLLRLFLEGRLRLDGLFFPFESRHRLDPLEGQVAAGFRHDDLISIFPLLDGEGYYLERLPARAFQVLDDLDFTLGAEGHPQHFSPDGQLPFRVGGFCNPVDARNVQAALP